MILEVKNIRKSFGDKEVLHGVSFQVESGKALGLLGRNGAGKTTTIRILMDVFHANSGEILLDGRDLSGLNVNERAAAGLGYAFQQPPAFKGMTVERLLQLAAGRELPEAVCCDLLSSVGICAREYLKREADATLSGGERKRIEIATVLAKSHKICIFDEPEAGIDLWSFSMLVKRFEGIHRTKQESLLLISHQEKIIRMADRILIVDGGRIQDGGSREEMTAKLFQESCDCACMGGGKGDGGCEAGCGSR